MSAAVHVGRLMVEIINETTRRIIRRHFLPSLRKAVNDNARVSP
jgi:hypothetical protein